MCSVMLAGATVDLPEDTGHTAAFERGVPIVLPQIEDLQAEADELHRLLATLKPADWQRATQFKQWTIDDIVQHLHIGDAMGLASATGPAAFDALLADIRAKRASGMSRVAETQARLGDLTGARLLERWRAHLDTLCDALAAKAPSDRLKWAGSDMGVRMFATARQMETWAHGQAIYDLLGLERPAPSPRIRNIAEIGVRTFGFTYRNRDLPVPTEMPHVRLDTPFGETWDWNAPSGANVVSGDILAFCQVVTQTRNIADTVLSVQGTTARHWMSIAQCFAGPPETPPAPGTRYRAATPR
jgi:uncharacterized protein (TIGR03084 family)